MKRQIIFTIILLFNSADSIAKSQTDVTKIPELQKELNIKYYETLQTFAFNDLRSDVAYTSLFKKGSKKADASYFVAIHASANGPFLFFSTSENCTLNSINESDIITVNGQNIKTRSYCVKEEN